MASGSWKDLRKNATTVLEGEFPVEVTKVTAKKSSAGNPMFALQVKVTGGPYAGRTMFANLVVTENQFVQQKFFAAMEVLGADEKFFDAEPTDEMIVSQLTGRQAIVTVEKREWQGTDRENITEWKKAGGPFVSTAGSSSPFGGASALPKAEPTVAADPSKEPDDPF